MIQNRCRRRSQVNRMFAGTVQILYRGGPYQDGTATIPGRCVPGRYDLDSIPARTVRLPVRYDPHTAPADVPVRHIS